MIQRILSIAVKIVVGIAAFYLLMGFAVIPFAAKWVIESQGTKILKHPVHVRAVHLNPIMFSLGIYGFEIRDDHKQVLAGFEKFGVDISALALMKKVYRVESVRLDGLQVNVRLLPGGRINLLDLVPAAETPGMDPQAVDKPVTASAEAQGSQPIAAIKLPVVVIDLLTLQRGRVHFVDETVTPQFATTLGDMDLKVTGLSTQQDSQAKVVFQAKLDDKGVIALEALLKPFVQPLELETTFTLNSYALTILSPYVGKYTGRSLAEGKFDLKMDYRIANEKLTASHKLLIQGFEFGDKVESQDALNLPFGFALALLEDSRGQININLPVTGDLADPEFKFWPLIGQVVRNFFFKVATKPFAFLGSMLGSEEGTDELGYVRFEPGRSDLTDAEKEKLRTLIKGLKERPKLSLEINGSYDPEMDWKVIKMDIFTKDYAQLKQESARTEAQVYQLLYQRRFGVRDLWALARRYKTKAGVYDDLKLNEEIKRQLIENAPADRLALDVLAGIRAQKTYDAIMAQGFDASRVKLGAIRKVQGSMGYVPLEFTLTVFADNASAGPGVIADPQP